MPSPAEQVARTFGIPHDVYDRQAYENGQPSIELERLRSQVHTAVMNRQERRRVAKMAKQSAVDQVHKTIAGLAKESGVPHAAFLNALTDKYFKEQNDGNGDSDAADEGEGDIENGDDDAGSMKSMQDMKTASPAPSPSPVDRTTGADSPRYLARHTSGTVRLANGDRLLLNVTADEMKQARTGRA